MENCFLHNNESHVTDLRHNLPVVSACHTNEVLVKFTASRGNGIHVTQKLKTCFNDLLVARGDGHVTRA